MRIASSLRLGLAVCGLATASCAPVAASQCRIARVVDGDTFHCEDGRKVRLIGMDAPEVGQGAAGRASREALRRMLPRGRSVRLESDAAARDRYGRVLAYAWAAGRLVNEAMVRDGWAVLYTVPPNVRYVARLQRAQREARAAGAGLWRSGGFECLPSEYRRNRCGRRVRRRRAGRAAGR